MESQDTAAVFFLKLWPQIEANKNKIVTGAAIIAVAVILMMLVVWRHDQNQIAAGEAMTGVLMSLPPNADLSQVANTYLMIAEDYRGTAAGRHSLLQAAAALFAAGKYTDAQGYFQQFLDEYPDDELSGQAALGVAKCLEAEGKINDAAGAYQHVINDFARDEDSVAAAKFALALLNLQSAHFQDALRLFQEVAQAVPYSQIGNEAEQFFYEYQSLAPAPVSPTPATSPALSQ